MDTYEMDIEHVENLPQAVVQPVSAGSTNEPIPAPKSKALADEQDNPKLS